MAESAPEQSALDAALHYRACGFSVIPVAPNKRPYGDVLPLGDDGKRHWEHLCERLPSEDEIAFWFRKAPEAGIGIVLGRVSGNAVALDVDDGLFSNWVQSRSPIPRSGAWCNVTGSGKIHVIVRTRGSTAGSVLIDERDGRRLADIRGDGQYVVAPPSVYGATGGRYRVWSGGPAQVPVVEDANALWGLLRESYARGALHTPNGLPYSNGTVTASAEVSTRPPSASRHPLSCIPPLQGAERAALEARVGRTPSAQLRRALLEGVGLNESPWNAGDWSTLDFMLIKECMQCGWTDDEIHAAWATLPVGEHTYRNTVRPNHGQRYLLDHTIPAARKKLDEEREAAKRAAGKNYRIVKVLKLMHQPPVWHVTFERTDVPGLPQGVAVLTNDELTHERAFKVATFRDLGWVIQLQGEHKGGEQFWALVQAISDVAEEVHPPRSATEEGQLQEMVRKALRDRLSRNGIPSTAAEIRFGWVEVGEQVAYVSGHALMAHLRDTNRHPPTPPKVWSALQRMGASSRRLRIGEHAEEFWLVPLSALD